MRAKRRAQNGDRTASGSGSNTLDPDSLDELAYVDTLPEVRV